MTAQQLEEWKVFDRLEPFGPERDDQRVAHIVTTLLNLHRNEEKHPEHFTLHDGGVFFGEDADDVAAEIEKKKVVSQPKQDWRQMQRMMKQHKDGA
jgi:hypothetical protein